MALGLTTAGESHGPALAAIVTGLPSGLLLDKEAIDADLRRRQQGYGRSPRQKLESDEVEVLSGLRHGVTLGTPLTLVVRNQDHANWTWGMSPWPPEGEPAGKGTKPVTLPRPGHADLAGVLKHGHDDVRNALESRLDAITRAAVPAAAGSGTVDSETAQRLKSLGYIVAPAATKRTSFGVKDDPKRLVALNQSLDRAVDRFTAGSPEEAAQILEQGQRERPAPLHPGSRFDREHVLVLEERPGAGSRTGRHATLGGLAP